MNVWKSIAAVTTAGLVASIGVQVAAAEPNMDVCKYQPNMMAAYNDLTAALAALGKAERNKGGWLPEATSHTKAALAAVEKGCAAAEEPH
jgi:hypothetical protein